METKNMTSKNLLVFLAVVFALAFVGAGSASAFGEIVSVEVNGVEALPEHAVDLDLSNIAGSRLPVLVVFKSDGNAEDVRVSAWISGERRDLVETARFDVIPGKTYTRVLQVELPFDLDDDLHQSRRLEVVVESEKQGTADEASIALTVQRESHALEVLSVNMDSQVNTGGALAVDVVLKNRGSQFSEDAFVVVRIPQLGLQQRTYFGDLSPIDQDNPDKEDAVERRVYLRIPHTVAPGLYDVEIEAFDDDSITRVSRRVLVTGGAEEATLLVPSVMSRNFAVGETAKYTIAIVNRGNTVRVYDFSVNAPSNLNVVTSEQVLIIPAGTSRSVDFDVTSTREGSYSFSVDIRSDADFIQSKTFRTEVEGESRASAGPIGSAGNATVLLTVVLAIVFIVLLVVLIVLLTRKPEKTEELSESYY